MSDPLPPPGPPSGGGSAVPPPPPALPPQPLSPSDERLWAMLAHLGGIVLGFLSGLIVMLVFGKRSAFTDDQAKEALNFQITLLIGYLISFVLVFVIVGIFLLFALSILNIAFCILAGVAANNGERYRYPVCLRLVS